MNFTLFDFIRFLAISIFLGLISKAIISAFGARRCMSSVSVPIPHPISRIL